MTQSDENESSGNMRRTANGNRNNTCGIWAGLRIVWAQAESKKKDCEPRGAPEFCFQDVEPQVLVHADGYISMKHSSNYKPLYLNTFNSKPLIPEYPQLQTDNSIPNR